MQHLVSVIIPTYNEEDTIGSLLERLNSEPDIEIIVSDGGSKDRTVQICRAFDITLVMGLPGRGSQLNLAAQAAQGDILLFLHADSVIDERVIDEIVHAVSQGYQWGCCIMRFDHQALFYRRLARWSNLRARWLSSCYGDQGIYCTTEFFHQLHGFRNLPFLEDLDFSHRARRICRGHMINGCITTSSRRFEQGGRWRTWWKMQMVKSLFIAGVKPERLDRWYHSRREVA